MALTGDLCEFYLGTYKMKTRSSLLAKIEKLICSSYCIYVTKISVRGLVYVKLRPGVCLILS